MKTTSSARASQPSGRFFNGIALAVLGGLTVMGCLQEPDVIVRGEEGSPMGGLMGEGGRMGEGGAGGRELPSTETCNGLDDDQDGTLDEDLTPPPAALSEGVCIGQVQRCAGADGWQPPDLGAILDYEASERRCDALDNDCDGVTDEALEMACGVDEGACTAGVQQCEDGAFSACRSAVEPTPEVCDFVDNDCDGEVDDGLECACADGAQQECGTDIGLCQVGQQACVDGRWGPCEGEVGLTAEVCNNQDDDCDGQIDDSIAGIPTMCGTGECAAAGVSSCVAGEMVDNCMPGQEIAEQCDGRDNDCDGRSDEGSPGSGQNCDTGLQGICEPGVTACNAGRIECEQDAQAGNPICGDDADQDCDGDSDEFRNACGNCGDQNEMGTGCRACLTIRGARTPFPEAVLINGTIDVASDADYYCLYLWDNVNVPNQTVRVSLAATTGFNFDYHADIYRNADECERGNALGRVSGGVGRSGLTRLTEPTLDARGSGDDSGTYVVRVTAEGVDCDEEYQLLFGLYE